MAVISIWFSASPYASHLSFNRAEPSWANVVNGRANIRSSVFPRLAKQWSDQFVDIAEQGGYCVRQIGTDAPPLNKSGMQLKSRHGLSRKFGGTLVHSTRKRFQKVAPGMSGQGGTGGQGAEPGLGLAGLVT